MGREATRRLLALIKEPQLPLTRSELPTKLIVRASTQALMEKVG
jgi:DNA-binding LacI/PurR family transcriptional regulator